LTKMTRNAFFLSTTTAKPTSNFQVFPIKLRE
jgi:hypothetical protein